MKALRYSILGLLMICLALSASGQDDKNISKLISQGEGKVSAAPDIATVTLGVETRNESASSAAAENAAIMNRTISALLDSGVMKKDIQTSQFSIRTLGEDEQTPISRSGSEGQAKNATPPVFVVTNQVVVRTNNTEGVGRILDVAIAAGSNSILDISFDIENSEPQMDAALEEAVKDARRKAEVMAQAANVSLGKVLEISGGYSYVNPMSSRLYSYSVGAPAPTQVLPGQMEVSASATVTYQVSA